MGKHTLTKHHRKCKSHGCDPKDPENISMVQEQHHRAFHLLFSNLTPEEIAYELNRIWIDKNWTMVAVPSDIHVAGERHPVYALPTKAP